MDKNNQKHNSDILKMIVQFGNSEPNSVLNFGKGERLIEQGQKGNECYFIKKGQVKILVKDKKSQVEKEIAIRSHDTVIGEIAFLDSETPRTASVEVISEKATFICLRKKDLSNALQFKPNAQKSIIKFLTKLATERIMETKNFMDGLEKSQ